MEDYEEIKNLKSWISEDYFDNKSVIITGGCGFIGGWLCSTILKMGGKITCVDNLSTGLQKNLDYFKKFKNFNYINKDVQKITFADLPKKADFVFHCASRASPEDYHVHQIDTLESNSLGSKILLDYSLKNDSRFLFTSTSEVYGNPSVIPTPESYYGYVNTMGRRSCYDEGKRYSESLIHAYSETYDLDVKLVRIFNTFGPGLRPDGGYGRALSRFIFQCLENKPIKIFGDGTQTRSFNYITDTISGIIAVLATKSFKGQPVNVGNSKEITILYLAEIIKKITQSKSKITFSPKDEDDPIRRCPDTKKLEGIGWMPKILLEDGIIKTTSWIKKNYQLEF